MEYYDEHRAEELTYHRNDYRTLVDDLKQMIGECKGAFCAMCGSKEFELLELDHINGNGAELRKRFKGHKTEKRYFRNHPSEAIATYQLLCPTCNEKKKRHNNEMPYSS